MSDLFAKPWAEPTPADLLRMKAAHALHDAQAWPAEPAELVNARKALADLRDRKGYNDLTRDDRRLADRYALKIAELEVDIVDHARSLGLLESE